MGGGRRDGVVAGRVMEMLFRGTAHLGFSYYRVSAHSDAFIAVDMFERETLECITSTQMQQCVQTVAAGHRGREVRCQAVPGGRAIFVAKSAGRRETSHLEEKGGGREGGGLDQVHL